MQLLQVLPHLLLLCVYRCCCEQAHASTPVLLRCLLLLHLHLEYLPWAWLQATLPLLRFPLSCVLQWGAGSLREECEAAARGGWHGGIHNDAGAAAAMDMWPRVVCMGEEGVQQGVTVG